MTFPLPILPIRQGAVANGNDAFTKILLHMDGADGATTFTDVAAGGSAHTWTARGNAQIDTGITKFGTATGLFDGTGDWIDTPDHADFTIGANDFVCDCWFNFAGSAGTRYQLAGQIDSGGTSASASIYLEHTAGNKIGGAVHIGATAFAVAGTTNITTSGWHHVALVRHGTNIYVFVDGVKEGTTGSVSGSINDSSQLWRVGANAFGNAWPGSIDEFRLSIGTNRGWTGASFTVPVSPYS